jgi:hypothetical protein
MRYDNIRPITDPRVTEMIKSVTDQMEPKGRTETHAERSARLMREEVEHVVKEHERQAAEERHRARRHLRLVKTSKRNRLTLAAHRMLDWLDKQKPRR